MSGMTSQPNLNSLVAALAEYAAGYRAGSRCAQSAQSDYWEAVREYYYPFEEGMNRRHRQVYQHEMPGGQYTNLRAQAKSLGLEDRWNEIADAMREVNRDLRRYREGDALQQSRRRYGPVHGDQRPDGHGRA